MKHLLAIWILATVSAAAFGQVTPPKKTFYVQPNAKLNITHYDSVVVDAQIGSGKNLVFFYEWNSAKNPQLADADRTEKLYFELTARQAKSFRAKGAELAKANTVRCRLCFCLEGGCRPNTKGELTVKKVGKNRYAVKFKDDPEADRYLVDEVFTLQKAVP